MVRFSLCSCVGYIYIFSCYSDWFDLLQIVDVVALFVTLLATKALMVLCGCSCECSDWRRQHLWGITDLWVFRARSRAYKELSISCPRFIWSLNTCSFMIRMFALLIEIFLYDLLTCFFVLLGCNYFILPLISPHFTLKLVPNDFYVQIVWVLRTYWLIWLWCYVGGL